jgi:large subunit ribosomal protein L18
MEETLRMAKSSNYRVQLRRRREGKTDYQARKALVISGKPRLVARTSIRNVTAQLVVAKPRGDEVLAAANSRELVEKFGWMAPTGNVPSAYLTGLLCGFKAKAAGVEGAILDIGLVAPTKGAKIFAVLSGVLDAGVEIPYSEEKIVKERTKGDHIAKYAKTLGLGSEEYTAKFSQYIAQGVAPEKMPEHFNKVKAEIVQSFKGAKTAAEQEPKTSAKEKAPEPVAKATKSEVKEKVSKEKAPMKAAAKEKAPRAGASKEKAAPKAKSPKQKASKKGEKVA